MATENPEHIQSPKTEFSFYPQDVQAIIAQEEFAGLVINIKQRPHHVVQIFYELWRTHRDEEMYSVLEHTFVRNITMRAIFPKELTFTPDEFTQAISYAHIKHDVPIESCSQFLETVIKNALKVDFKVPFTEHLDSTFEQVADITVAAMIKNIEEKKKAYVGADLRNN